jgi:hypothetical protein
MTAHASTLKTEFPRVAGLTEVRGTWGEITGWHAPVEARSLAGKPPTLYHFPYGKPALTGAQVLSLFKDCLPETFVQFDRKGRGDAVNVDLYGYDPTEQIAVVQARHAFRRGAKHFMSVRKTYFLCGHNERTHDPFRHPVAAAAVHGALRHKDVAGSKIPGVELVRRIQMWMWDVTLNQYIKSIRQGDVLVVPEPRIKWMKDPTGPKTMTLADSHRVTADDVFEDAGKIYALNPHLDHVKDQHAPVQLQGWCSVRVARDVSAWNFAIRLGD